ncbi:MAG: hypothetical protein DRO11_05175 [Methanobacteriota archaeon]|nr:MAG: hypothetical protein DRO11_05175 [Euryarchaeota archaeon]
MNKPGFEGFGVEEAHGFETLDPRITKILGNLGIHHTTPMQSKAVETILRGENLLIMAPTGTGKTEAAFLPLLHRIVRDKPEPIALLYLTPLRALNRDLVRRLSWWGRQTGVSVEVRHGDTPQKTRRKQAENPPLILITTPESLQTMLPGSRLRKHLENVRFVIVDEIHSLVENKRGSQLSIALERLRRLAGDYQIIGLSATIGKPIEVAKFLAGSGRKPKVLSDKNKRLYHIKIEYPQASDALAGYTHPGMSQQFLARIERIKHLIDKHGSTLLFVNSREWAEHLGMKLRELGVKAEVHHSSLSSDVREDTELRLRLGELACVVATSSLELGIDIGNIDLVIHYQSPRNVSSLLQRAGRAKHHLGGEPRAVIIADSLDDVLESMAVIRLAHLGRLEHPTIPEHPLDVVGHQVVGIILENGCMGVDQVYKMIVGAWPYKNMGKQEFLDVVRFMEQLGYLRVDGGVIYKTRRSRSYYYTHVSTIPDELQFPVVDCTTGKRIGVLGEDYFYLHAAPGKTVAVKGQPWRIVEIAGDQVLVVPASDPRAEIPGWEGYTRVVPWEVARLVGYIRWWIANQTEKRKEVVNKLSAGYGVEDKICAHVVDYVLEQKLCGFVPTHNAVFIEVLPRCVVLHSCNGTRVNNTLRAMLQHQLGLERVVADPYRVLVVAPCLDPEEILETILSVEPIDVLDSLPDTYHMRHVAIRFGAMSREMRYKSPKHLETLASRYRNTPIYKESRKEVISKFYDPSRLSKLQENIKNGKTVLEVVERDVPSPIAQTMLQRYYWCLDPSPPGKPEELVKTLDQQTVFLTCYECAHSWMTKPANLPEKPFCPRCESKLLVPTVHPPQKIQRLLSKKTLEHLGEEEKQWLVRAKMCADLTLVYGKRAIHALSIHGVGPTTAARILAKMEEKKFYEELINASRQYAKTRRYWDK